MKKECYTLFSVLPTAKPKKYQITESTRQLGHVWGSLNSLYTSFGGAPPLKSFNYFRQPLNEQKTGGGNR